MLGFNTDREILAGIDATRACVIGAGGAMQTLAPALPDDTRVFSRRGDWPPDAEGCDLIVNATPVRDELLVVPVAGQTVVELAYQRGDAETALVARGARRRLRGRSTVSRRSSARAPKSFELWTGVEAPVSVMRDAVRAAV